MCKRCKEYNVTMKTQKEEEYEAKEDAYSRCCCYSSSSTIQTPFWWFHKKKQCSQACLIWVSTKETATATIVKGDHMLSVFKMEIFFFGFVASYYWDDDKRKKFYNIEHDDSDKEDVLETINHYKWYNCTRNKKIMTKRNRNRHQKERHWKVRCQQKKSSSTREKKEDSDANKCYVKILY